MKRPRSSCGKEDCCKTGRTNCHRKRFARPCKGHGRTEDRLEEQSSEGGNGAGEGTKATRRCSTYSMSTGKHHTLQPHQAGSNASGGDERPGTASHGRFHHRSDSSVHKVVTHAHQPDVAAGTGKPNGPSIERPTDHTRQRGCKSCGKQRKQPLLPNGT